MTLLRYRSPKNVAAHRITWHRCHHGTVHAVTVQCGPRIWSWCWRLCK